MIPTVTVPHVSLAAGGSKVKPMLPNRFVLLAAQRIAGGVVSTVAIVWLQVLVLPHESVASQARVATNVLPHVKLVTVLRTEMATVPQVSVALGVSKLKVPTPHSLVLFGEQAIDGAVVSMAA